MAVYRLTLTSPAGAVYVIELTDLRDVESEAAWWRAGGYTVAVDVADVEALPGPGTAAQPG